VPKTGKAAGRPVQDLTHRNGDPLNFLYAKEKVNDRTPCDWGAGHYGG
jgi:hypothetical protein